MDTKGTFFDSHEWRIWTFNFRRDSYEKDFKYKTRIPVIPKHVRLMTLKERLPFRQLYLLWQPKAWALVSEKIVCPALLLKEDERFYLVADWVDNKVERKNAMIHLSEYTKRKD